MGVESAWSLRSWFLGAIWKGDWWVMLVENCSCANEGCICFKFELFCGVWSCEYWGQLSFLLTTTMSINPSLQHIRALFPETPDPPIPDEDDKDYEPPYSYRP